MSMQIEWKADYELGVEDIDYQHHFFFNLINRLENELKDHESIDYQAGIISELNAYARFHFISEENMMVRSGYPGLEEHKILHCELIDQLSSRENMLLIDRSARESRDIITFLVDWFFDHTMTIDRLFADYLHGNDR